MCNPKASCSHTINERGECVVPVKNIKIAVRGQTKEKQDVLSPQKKKGDFVKIHLSIYAENFPRCSGNVEGGVGNKDTSIFSKPKTTLKNKCSDMAQPTNGRAAMQAIGRT
jgi:hypothetical protein